MINVIDLNFILLWFIINSLISEVLSLSLSLSLSLKKKKEKEEEEELVNSVSFKKKYQCMDLMKLVTQLLCISLQGNIWT